MEEKITAHLDTALDMAQEILQGVADGKLDKNALALVEAMVSYTWVLIADIYVYNYASHITSPKALQLYTACNYELQEAKRVIVQLMQPKGNKRLLNVIAGHIAVVRYHLKQTHL